MPPSPLPLARAWLVAVAAQRFALEVAYSAKACHDLKAGGKTKVHLRGCVWFCLCVCVCVRVNVVCFVMYNGHHIWLRVSTQRSSLPLPYCRLLAPPLTGACTRRLHSSLSLAPRIGIQGTATLSKEDLAQGLQNTGVSVSTCQYMLEPQ